MFRYKRLTDLDIQDMLSISVLATSFHNTEMKVSVACNSELQNTRIEVDTGSGSHYLMTMQFFLKSFALSLFLIKRWEI